MTYGAIDKERFTYLLSLGTDEFELRRFFSDSRIQLIQRGAKVQNLPHGVTARIRAIAYELPSATDETLRSWFSQNVTMSDPEMPEVIVETFKLHEEFGEKLEESQARRLARSSLVHLFDGMPSAVLLGFLRSPIGGIVAEPRPEKVEPLPPPQEIPASSENLAQALLALVQGQDVDKYLDGLPSDIAGLIVGLQSATQGRLQDAQHALEGLPVGSPARAKLDQFLKQQAARPLRSAPRGVTVLPSNALDGSFENETDEVLGYCTNAASVNAVFLQPMAVVRAGSIQRLTNEERRKLFPANGDVMAFPGTAYPRQPRRGEVGVWRVEEHPTEKATRFHLKTETRKVYEMFSVPFPSTDYDSVREFLREHTERRAMTVLQQSLFVLSDGLVIGARADKSDLTKDDAFEAGLLSWNELPVVRLEGRMFCVGPLPKEHGIYECASIAVSIRKLLRPYVGTGKAIVGLTRAQLSDVVQFIGSHESGVAPARMHRIRAELTQIGENQEGLEALTQELLVHPSVKERIDQLVVDAAEKQVSERNSIQAAIVRLKKERDEWDEKIRTQKEEHKKLRDNTAKVVKAAFEKARTDNIGTLAELAVFQELTSGPHDSPGAPLFQASVREFTKVSLSAAPILQRFGIGARKASAFAAAGELAARLGLIICVQGIASRLVTEAWAQAIGGGILVDATIGLVEDASIKSYFTGDARPDVVAVLDANLSALDIYARPISDAVISGILSDGTRSRTAVFFSLSEGVGHLPLPRSFERLSVFVDLEGKYNFDVPDVDDLLTRAFDPEDGILTTRLWTPAGDKLKQSLSALDVETQRLVLPVLIAPQASP